MEVCHPVAEEVTMWWPPYFTYLFSLYTLLSCIKVIAESCGYVGLSGRRSFQYQANSRYIYMNIKGSLKANVKCSCNKKISKTMAIEVFSYVMTCFVGHSNNGFLYNNHQSRLRQLVLQHGYVKKKSCKYDAVSRPFNKSFVKHQGFGKPLEAEVFRKVP